MTSMHHQQLIAPTKRSHIVFLENACVEVSSGALVYKKTGDGDFNDYNIPYANTSMILLGKSVQITQDSIRRLSDSGVMVCLCGFDPGLSQSGHGHVQLLEPQIRQRNDAQMKKWGAIFLDEKRATAAAKRIIKERVSFTKAMWELLPEAAEYGVYPEEIKPEISALMKIVNDSSVHSVGVLNRACDTYERAVYSVIAPLYGFDCERRVATKFDVANRYLDIADYFAYGYAAIALHGLAIPFSFSVLNGTIGRSGLVLDVASIIKDGICLPVALECAMSGRDEDDLISSLRTVMHEQGVLDHLFKTIRNLCDIC